jgi:hypothetical protein
MKKEKILFQPKPYVEKLTLATGRGGRKIVGAVWTLYPSEVLPLCSSGRIWSSQPQLPVYSSGASLNRRSSSWRSAGICVSRFRTATSRRCSPSEVARRSRHGVALGPAVCSGTKAALAPAPQADERLVAGRRDVRAGERQMGVLVPGGGLQRCDDRLPSLG